MIGSTRAATARASRAALQLGCHLGSAEVELAAHCRVVARRGVRRVVLEDVAELVACFGRPQQVGGDRRVQLEAEQLDALGEQRAHQRLRVVATEAHRAEGCRDRGVGEVGRRDPQDVCPLRSDDDGEAGNRRASRLAVVRRGERDGLESREGCERLLGRLADTQFRVQLTAIG